MARLAAPSLTAGSVRSRREQVGGARPAPRAGANTFGPEISSLEGRFHQLHGQFRRQRALPQPGPCGFDESPGIRQTGPAHSTTKPGQLPAVSRSLPTWVTAELGLMRTGLRLQETERKLHGAGSGTLRSPWKPSTRGRQGDPTPWAHREVASLSP